MRGEFRLDQLVTCISPRLNKLLGETDICAYVQGVGQAYATETRNRMARLCARLCVKMYGENKGGQHKPIDNQTDCAGNRPDCTHTHTHTSKRAVYTHYLQMITPQTISFNDLQREKK